MSPHCLLGIDLGTSACKVIAVNPQGEIVARASVSYPLASPHPGWAEQDPDHWWNAAQRAIEQALGALPRGRTIEGIGLSGQMHGLVALDATGTALRPALLWCDQRAAPQCAAITEHAGGLAGMLQLIGNTMLPGFTAPQLLWMREHEPACFARLRRILNPKDYLRHGLTGEFATEVSDASGTGLFDVRKRVWSAPMLTLLDLPRDLLPEVVESSQPTGTLRPTLAARWGLPAGIPVFGGGGDAVIQTTSMGVVDRGRLGVTLGTAGIVAAAGRGCPEPDGRLQIACGNAPDRWQIMGVTLSAGGAFEWLRAALARFSPDGIPPSYEALVAQARSTEAGAAGLLFLPYLLGERCPHIAPDGRGAWVGLTVQHTGAHLVRSVMEGVALNLRSIAALLTPEKWGDGDVRVSGGATSEPFWLQLLANVLQCEVSTVTGAPEGGAYGAVLVAGVGSGRWGSLDEAVKTLRVVNRYSPCRSLAPLYDARMGTFRALYGALAQSFERIAEEPSAADSCHTASIPTHASPLCNTWTGADHRLDLGNIPIRGVVFDLDGTLVDSACDIADALAPVLARHGLAPPVDFVERFIGEGPERLITHLYAALGVTATPARIAADVADYLARSSAAPVRHATLFTGTASAIAALRSAGLRLGVCTNKSQRVAEAVLHHFGLREAFDAVIGGDTLPERKPAPLPLLKTLACMEITPQEAIFIGDTTIDAACARHAGVRSLIVTWGGGKHLTLLDTQRLMAFSDLEAALCPDTATGIPIESRHEK